MIDGNRFERMLGVALRSYAAEATIDVDPDAVARAAAARNPRRPVALPLPPARLATGRWVLRWTVLAAVLVAATLVAALLVGSSPAPTPAPTSSPGAPAPADGVPQLPGVWWGDWEAVVVSPPTGMARGSYVLDWGATALVEGPDGEPLEWLGGVAAFEGPFSGGQVTLRGPSPCGDGTYVVRWGPAGIEIIDRDDACVRRVEILTGRVWARPASIPILPGVTYDSGRFEQPFRFVGPPLPAGYEAPQLRAMTERGVLILGSRAFSWEGQFLDDVPVYADICALEAMLPDIPETPADVGRWLRAASPAVQVSAPTELTVDGRAAYRYELSRFKQPECPGNRGSIRPGVGIGWYADRIYAIPTGEDTILFVTKVSSTPQVNEALLETQDALVRSLTFD